MEALIKAAIKIRELRNKQRDKSRQWLELAAEARKPGVDQEAIKRRARTLNGVSVIDFGDAIEDLIDALEVYEKSSTRKGENKKDVG